MKVLDLHCRSEHVFEGWFASEEDFQSQLGKGLVQCPLCGDEQLQKRLSAPRLNLRVSASARAPVPTAEPSPAPQLPSDASQAAAWLQRMRQVVAQSEDVGERFTEEANAAAAGRGHSGAAAAPSAERATAIDACPGLRRCFRGGGGPGVAHELCHCAYPAR